MEVKVRFYSSLLKYAGGKREYITVTLPEGAGLVDLKKHFGIKPGEAGLVIVDGKLAKDQHPLFERSRVEIYPFFGGG